MKQKIKTFLLLLSIIAFVIFPTFIPNTSLAQSGLVPCGTDKEPITPVLNPDGTSTGETGGEIINPCGFNHFFELVNNVVDFLLFYLAIPIAAIIFAFAGIKLVFSGGNASQMQKAKSTMIDVAIGLALAAGAWLIVHTILNILGYTGVSFGI